jgi:hypothetical protein
MPKQDTKTTTAREKDRHEALIEHARRVKEILAANEKNRSPFMKWSKQYRHVDMSYHPYSKRGIPTHRSGLFVKGEDGVTRRAFRPPNRGVGEREAMIQHMGLFDDHLVYVPPGIQSDSGRGKPRRKKAVGKR